MASARVTASTSLPVSSNWYGDTLTAIVSASDQRIASRQAWLSTHSPSGTISPISSASGMNSAGDTRPRSGWRQRSSASKPTMAWRSRSICGW